MLSITTGLHFHLLFVVALQAFSGCGNRLDGKKKNTEASANSDGPREIKRFVEICLWYFISLFSWSVILFISFDNDYILPTLSKFATELLIELLD